MGREIILFKSKEKKSTAEVADILRLVADKITSGAVTLNQDNDSLRLEVPASVELQIKAEEEEGSTRTKRSLELEIEWVVGESGKPSGGTTIS